MADEVIGRGQHAARAARLVADGDDLARLAHVVLPVERNGDHELDDVASRVVVAGLRVFGESPDQVLEDVAHLHRVDGLRVEIDLAERLHDRQEAVALVHLGDLRVELERGQDLLHAAGEARDVLAEVPGEVVRVVAQLLQRQRTPVVELVMRQLEKLLLGRLDMLRGVIHDGLLVRLQRALEPPDDRHRDDDVLELLMLIRPTQPIRDGPDHVHFRGDIDRIVIPRCIKSHFHGEYFTKLWGQRVCFDELTRPERILKLQSRLHAHRISNS